MDSDNRKVYGDTSITDGLVLRGVGQLGSSRMIVHITDFVRRFLLHTKQHRWGRTKVTWNMCQLRIELTFSLFKVSLERDENLSKMPYCCLYVHLMAILNQNRKKEITSAQ